ncbi:cytochrome c oxidase assembly factor 3, mitochondrial-like [Anneissia japonica]|uniref:cytochrome c oxidase assembly factor 3, mitochondrial-like n=1 Tax=Anneissia japonica TaxID=1529436 RepID=UPI001425B523|nr:cytochrome c oxidase assembly factor 3, mitochondrial-like [Anneissia japonica]
MAASSSNQHGSKPPELMTRVNITTDNLTKTDREYMAKVTKAHMEKINQIKRASWLKRNVAVALLLGAGVAGVYTYSIYAVSQEKFLEDFDDPNKPT